MCQYCKIYTYECKSIHVSIFLDILPGPGTWMFLGSVGHVGRFFSSPIRPWESLQWVHKKTLLCGYNNAINQKNDWEWLESQLSIVMTGGWFMTLLYRYTMLYHVIPTLSDWNWVYHQTANHGAHGIYAWLCMYICGPDHVRILPHQNNLPKSGTRHRLQWYIRVW